MAAASLVPFQASAAIVRPPFINTCPFVARAGFSPVRLVLGNGKIIELAAGQEINVTEDMLE